jgi:glycosyltransferase involved in cell wall biosynthesis
MCERRLPAVADAVIADTRALEEMFRGQGRVSSSRLFYIPYCVQEYMLRNGDGAKVRRALGLGDAPVAIYCGALHPHNYDCDLLIDAMARVREESPSARMLIVGDGGARPGLERAARLSGLPDRTILFTGWMPAGEIPDYIAAADVGVVPMRDTPASRARGLSKVLEYLCQGKPVVMPGIGQAMELTDNGRAGILVEPGDPAALAEGMIALLGDPSSTRERGEYGRTYAVRAFSADTAVDGLARIYRRIMP